MTKLLLPLWGCHKKELYTFFSFIFVEHAVKISSNLFFQKTEVDKDSVEVVNAENNEKENNVDKSASGFMDLTSTLLSLNVSGTSASGNQQDTSNNPAHDTSHEVQDILSDFHTNAGAPALPPKQNASTLNRPSSVQREKISNSLIALPRPPSRMSQSSVLSARPRGKTRIWLKV